MKKYLLLLCFCLSLSVQAENVTETRARAVAATFLESSLGASQGTRAGSVQLDLVYAGASSRASQLAPLYVFNNRNGKGFVVVSGDDRTRPVLGFSTTENLTAGQFTDPVKEWLDCLAGKIQSVRGRSDLTSARYAEEWKNVPCYSVNPAIRYESVLWGDSEPFNLELPSFVNSEGEQLHTRFDEFNVALAILFRHHEWPERGQGVVPGYEYQLNDKPVSIGQRVLGKPYLWDKMPLYVNKSTPQESTEQIARLMTDLACMVKTQYREWGARPDWQSMYDIAAILPNYMDVSPDVRLIKQGFYTSKEWQRILLKSLKEVGPFMLKSPRWVVIDGYLKDGFYHVNLADKGNGNGYFLLEPVEGMDDYLLGGQEYEQWAIVDLRKNDGQIVRSDQLYIKNFIACVPKVEIGKQFGVYVDGIQYILSPEIEGEFELVLYLVDRNGNLKEMISRPRIFKKVSSNNYYHIEFRCTITKPIEPADRIRLYYKGMYTPDWKLINRMENVPFEVVFKDNQGTIENIEGKISLDINRRFHELSVKTDTDMTVKAFVGNRDVTDKCERKGNLLLITERMINSGSVVLFFKEGEAVKRVNVYF